MTNFTNRYIITSSYFIRQKRKEKKYDTQKIPVGEIFVAIDKDLNLRSNAIYFHNYQSSDSDKAGRRHFIQEMKENNPDCEIIKKGNYYETFEMPVTSFMQHATKVDN